MNNQHHTCIPETKNNLSVYNVHFKLTLPTELKNDSFH